MKHIVSCILLLAAMLLSGCAASPIYRGVEASGGAFVSTYSPVVSVQPAPGYEHVLSGYKRCFVAYENSMQRTLAADVWASLNVKEGSQLITVLAECSSDLFWDVRHIGTDFQSLKILYEHRGIAPHDATVHVYVRPSSIDPWTPLFSQAQKAAWQGNTLVARYEWTGGADSTELIVEYREPSPEILPGLAIKSEELAAFIMRSQKAFTLSGVKAPVNLIPRMSVNVPDRLLAPVLGSLSAKHILMDI